MVLKKLVGRALYRVGYNAVHKEVLPHLGLCLHLKKLFESQRIDTVWDVGANRGQFYRLLRKGIEFRGRILSFEPVPYLYKRLAERSATDPEWHVFPYVLGEEARRVAINITKADDMSAFLTPDASHTDRFRESNTTVDTAMVDIKCLDDVYRHLCERYPIQRSYLKMDTQGYDLKVVAGAGAVISNFVALQTEASVLPMYEGMPDYQTSIARLREAGFELSGVFPVMTDERLRLIEFDCVMVNPSRIDRIPARAH